MLSFVWAYFLANLTAASLASAPELQKNACKKTKGDDNLQVTLINGGID